MPRVNDEYLNCSIYLYRSRHEAEEGINIGGSGFLISVPAEIIPGPEGFVYAVTNVHVLESGATCIRFNTLDGKFDVIELTMKNWAGSRKDDLAIYPLQNTIIPTMSTKAIPRSSLLTQDQAQRWMIGSRRRNYRNRSLYQSGGRPTKHANSAIRFYRTEGL